MLNFSQVIFWVKANNEAMVSCEKLIKWWEDINVQKINEQSWVIKNNMTKQPRFRGKKPTQLQIDLMYSKDIFSFKHSTNSLGKVETSIL